MNKTFLMLLKVGIVPVLLLVLSAKPFFSYFLGKDWIMTGVLIQIMSPWLFVMYINSALSYLISILSIQKKLIGYEVLLLISRVFAIGSGYYFLNSFIVAVSIFSAVGFLFNGVFLLLMFQFTKRYDQGKRKFEA